MNETVKTWCAVPEMVWRQWGLTLYVKKPRTRFDRLAIAWLGS